MLKESHSLELCKVCGDVFDNTNPYYRKKCCSVECSNKAISLFHERKFELKKSFPCGHSTDLENVYIKKDRRNYGNGYRPVIFRICRECSINKAVERYNRRKLIEIPISS